MKTLFDLPDDDVPQDDRRSDPPALALSGRAGACTSAPPEPLQEGFVDWFPFYPSAWDADTAHLSACEEGVYWRLVRHYMRTEKAPPDNDQALARIAGVSAAEFAPMAATIRAFFTPQGGLLHQKRCDRELSKQRIVSDKRARASQVANAKRWGNQGDPSDSDPNRTPRVQDITEQERTVEESGAPPTAAPRKRRSRSNGGSVGSPGTRIPEGFSPDDESIACCCDLGQDPERVTAEFIDFWKGVPGSRGVKVDWQGTFRNRCRQVADRRGAPHGNSLGPSRNGEDRGFTGALLRLARES